MSRVTSTHVVRGESRAYDVHVNDFWMVLSLSSDVLHWPSLALTASRTTDEPTAVTCRAKRRSVRHRMHCSDYRYGQKRVRYKHSPMPRCELP
eukprot:scaffold459_cov391-Prasinococcus_capsulatus_cf.AAC.7